MCPSENWRRTSYRAITSPTSGTTRKPRRRKSRNCYSVHPLKPFMILPPLNWPMPPDEPRLQSGEIHLWRIPLDDPSRLESARAVLSRDETARAARFIFEPDRNRFIVSHGALRMVLARYISAEPADLEFRT